MKKFYEVAFAVVEVEGRVGIDISTLLRDDLVLVDGETKDLLKLFRRCAMVFERAIVRNGKAFEAAEKSRGVGNG